MLVRRARERATGRICALKKVKMDKERDGFPLTSIREINIMLSLHHPNITDVSEVVVGDQLDSVLMVMEFVEHDLKGLMEDMPTAFTVAEVRLPAALDVCQFVNVMRVAGPAMGSQHELAAHLQGNWSTWTVTCSCFGCGEGPRPASLGHLMRVLCLRLGQLGKTRDGGLAIKFHVSWCRLRPSCCSSSEALRTCMITGYCIAI